MLILLPVLGLFAGCATPPPASDPDAVADFKATNDPLEPTNRFFYAVNDGILTYALTPVARQYQALVPRPVRTGIHNVLNNIGMPVQFVDDVLEAKPRRAGDYLHALCHQHDVRHRRRARPRQAGWLPGSQRDGGTTLALWGVPAGPYLYLRCSGRPACAMVSDEAMDAAYNPFTWNVLRRLQLVRLVAGGPRRTGQTAAHLKDIEQVKAGIHASSDTIAQPDGPNTGR